MSIFEKLQKEYDRMKTQDTESEIVDVNEDDIVLEKEDTAKNLMSPPQVRHKMSGESITEELLRQFKKTQNEANRKLEQNLMLHFNQFRTETNVKIDKLYEDIYTDSDDEEQQCKKRKLEQKKGERTDCRPSTAVNEDKTESQTSTNKESEKSSTVSDEFYDTFGELH